MHLALLVLLLSPPTCGVLCSDEAFDRYQLLLYRFYRQRMLTEQGAFLVRDADGRLRLIPWRQDLSTERSASFLGRMPANCIAVVHTHPVHQVEPSTHDRAEARRIRLPVLVVTPMAVTAAWPDGTMSYLVR